MRSQTDIRIDQIPAEEVSGFLFTTAMLAIALIAFPEIRFLTTIGLAGGITVAAWRYFWQNQTRW